MSGALAAALGIFGPPVFACFYIGLACWLDDLRDALAARRYGWTRRRTW